jgi:hypothetical protein
VSAVCATPVQTSRKPAGSVPVTLRVCTRTEFVVSKSCAGAGKRWPKLTKVAQERLLALVQRRVCSAHTRPASLGFRKRLPAPTNRWLMP